MKQMNEIYFDSISILAVRVDVVTKEELLDRVVSAVQSCDKFIVSNVNIHAINIAYKFKWFRDYINCSQVVFCDSVGVKLVAKFLTGRRLYRYTPPDWFDKLADLCAKHDFSIYFLGAQQAVVSLAAVIMREKHPGLKLVGLHHGFFEKTKNSIENQVVLDTINKLAPDILLVGFGMPTQEKWINENFDALNVHVVFSVGAFFDYFAGSVPRAPRWMTDNGLEWLGRLIIEPGRLWKRYVLGNPLFLWRVFVHEVLGFPLPK